MLEIVHPEMYGANSQATSMLLDNLEKLNKPLPSESWPTVYPGLDLIANRLTPMHRDKGGANSFYDHLVSFGQHHDAYLCLEELNAQFAYQPGTSVLFSGTALQHSVTSWSGERVVIAHYAKDLVMERLGVARPSLPTQLGWWLKYSQMRGVEQDRMDCT